jgi:hypothetical protein
MQGLRHCSVSVHTESNRRREAEKRAKEQLLELQEVKGGGLLVAVVKNGIQRRTRFPSTLNGTEMRGGPITARKGLGAVKAHGLK